MQNRRKTILINKKFQHHYAIVLVAMTVLATNIIIIGGILLPDEQRLHLSSSMSVVIGLIELFLVAGVWFASIRSTHRIAGPVYVFSRQLRAFGAGDLTTRIHLRDYDMFQDEAVEINNGLAQLNSTVLELKALVAEVQSSHSSGADVAPALEKLSQTVAALRTEEEN